MNKKILAFSVIGLLSMGLVMAIGYYALFSTSFNVLPSVVMDDDCSDVLGDVYAGEVVEGSECSITNNAPTERTIKIVEDSDEDVSVSYVSELTLTEKNVDFEQDVWTLVPDGETAVVEYTIVGNEFNAEVVSGQKEGYSLVYYKDNSERFSSPATAIGIDSISENLPYETDANADEYDYCSTNEYDTCHGAKLWYVPDTAINSEGNVDWSQASSILYETSLIQYNNAGEIVIYPSQTLTIKPIYKIGDYASGEYTITTTIE